MVAAFPPGAQDVFVSVIGKFFVLLIFFCNFALPGSYDHCCSDSLISFAC